MTVGVQIMADPRRAGLASRLQERLGLGDEQVTWDRRAGVWDTRCRATEAAAGQGADWTLVLQDDVLVCLDLIPAVEEALTYVPEATIVHLAVLRQRSCGLPGSIEEIMRRADDEGSSWVRFRGLLWGIAVAVPTSTVAAMLAWTHRWMAGAGDDTRIGQFYMRARWPTLYPRRALVDHALVPSLLQRGDPENSHGRVAYGFIGEQATGLGLNWQRGVVDL